MQATDILKKWLSYADYDPEQKSFNIMSVDYQFRKICDTVATFLPYDPDATLSVLFIKHRYTEVLKELRLNAFDVVSNPECVSEHVQMYSLLHSPDVDAIEEAVLDTLESIICKVMLNKQIGLRDKEKEKASLFHSVQAVAESLDGCNVEIYLRGGAIGKISNFSTSIHVFDRLADCLLTLEHSPDGIYLCFIRCGNTADGYFGFFIKSQGTILSINERINESYPGEHGRRRNNRWAERKKYTLFPYDFIFSFGDFDYKGYAKSHVIDEEKLAFMNLKPNAYMPLVIAMMLLAHRYSGFDTSELPIRFLDSLLPINLPMLDSNTKAMIQANGSQLVAAGSTLTVDMTSEGVLTAEYAEDLRKAPDDPKRYYEHGCFPMGPNLFVELWGEGFRLDTSKFLLADPQQRKQRRLLPADHAVVTPSNPEFVATERGMRVIAYKESREQLAEYIRDRMFEAYKEVGGADGIQDWWDGQIQKNKEKIFSLCIHAYRKQLAGNKIYTSDQLAKESCSFNYSEISEHIGVYLNTENRSDVAANFSWKTSPYTSDQLYVNSTGDNEIPLGSVKITEIKNSLGYIVMPQPIYCTLVADSSVAGGIRLTWTDASQEFIVDMATGNYGLYEPIDESLFGKILVEKIDANTNGAAQGGATLQNAKFQVINNSTNSVKIGDFDEAEPGEVCYEFYTDENGQFQSEAIFPLGTYTIKEAEAPAGYVLNTTWEQTFTVTESALEFEFTADNGKACVNTVIRGGLQILKYDSGLKENTDETALLEGISFSVISQNDQPIIFDSTTFNKGDVVLVLEIEWDGTQWSATTGNNILPYGTYKVQENPSASNSNMANDYYMLNTTPQTLTITDDLAIVDMTFYNGMSFGSIKLFKCDVSNNPLSGAKFLLEWSSDGTTWTAIKHTDDAYPAEGYTNTEVTDGCVVSGADGLIEFVNLNPGLQYRVTEVEAPNGYQLLAEPIVIGYLPTDTLTYELDVVNTYGYIMPNTGVENHGISVVVGTIMTILAMAFAVVVIADRRKPQVAKR